MLKLTEMLGPDCIVLDVQESRLDNVLRHLMRHMEQHRLVTPSQLQQLQALLQYPEKPGLPCIGRGVVLPHIYLEGLPMTRLLLARLREPLECGAPDGQPVDLVLLLVGRKEEQAHHLPTLAHIVRLLHHEWLLTELRSARDSEQAMRAVSEAEHRHA